MSSSDFTIDLEDSALLAAIDRAIARLDRPQDLLQDIGDKLESNARLRFVTKTDPEGKAWAPLGPETVDYWYKKRWPGGVPGSLLQRTNELLQSLAHNAGDDFVDIGTSRRVPGKSQPFWQVGLLHEFGTVTMPRRGFLTADPETGRLGAYDEADLLAIVNGYMGSLFD